MALGMSTWRRSPCPSWCRRRWRVRLGLTDQPGQSTMDTLQRFLSDRELLLVLDNCEHLIEATASLIAELLGSCPGLTLLTTSREPLGVSGEVTWGVPSLSLADEAVELFDDRARRARPDFRVDGRQHRSRHRDLPTPRRPATGHRTGRSTHPRALGDRHRRQPSRPLPPADRRSPHGGATPADPACVGRLVARAAVRFRANHVPALGRLRRRVRPRRGARGRWGGRDGALPGARPTHAARREVTGRRRRQRRRDPLPAAGDRCVSTRWRNSAKRATRQMPATAIEITTSQWQQRSTPRQTPTTNGN